MQESLSSECPFKKLYPSQLVRDDLFYMQLAYNQGVDAWNKDEVPIGAIILYQGVVIAAAHNAVESTGDPTAHAEILAITQAARYLGDWRLNGATLYVTKEPCPMCSGAAIAGRITRVVYALSDPKMGSLGSAYNVNTLLELNHRLQVDSGVLEPECRQLIQAFFEKKRLAKTERV